MGEAIIRAIPPGKLTGEQKALLPGGFSGEKAQPTVVLIDEIDKAPRDLPNDVLNEIAGMEFTVKEAGVTFKAGNECRPILVLTSNSEKNLPDAFLRRCVFFHIDFPKSKETLFEIVTRHFAAQPELTEPFIKEAAAFLLEIRELKLKKRPATAEFIAWLRVLRSLGIDKKMLESRHSGNPAKKCPALEKSFPILAKTGEDLELLREEYGFGKKKEQEK